jgi:ribonuclease HI
MTMYTLEFDGMLLSPSDAWPDQEGLLGYGWIIKRNNFEIARGFGVFLRKCEAGSNAAEYLALIEGLEALSDLRIRNEPIEIRGDAKCVIDQMAGYASVSSPLTLTLHRRTRKLARRFKSLTWVWVPRRENKHADKLSRRSFRYLHRSPALEREIKNPPFIQLYGGRLVPLLDLRIHAPAV